MKVKLEEGNSTVRLQHIFKSAALQCAERNCNSQCTALSWKFSDQDKLLIQFFHVLCNQYYRIRYKEIFYSYLSLSSTILLVAPESYSCTEPGYNWLCWIMTQDDSSYLLGCFSRYKKAHFITSTNISHGLQTHWWNTWRSSMHTTSAANKTTHWVVSAEVWKCLCRSSFDLKNIQ